MVPAVSVGCDQSPLPLRSGLSSHPCSQEAGCLSVCLLCFISPFVLKLGEEERDTSADSWSPVIEAASPSHPSPSVQSFQHGFSVHLQPAGDPKMSKSLSLPWRSSQFSGEDRLINNYKPRIRLRYKPSAWGLELGPIAELQRSHGPTSRPFKQGTAQWQALSQMGGECCSWPQGKKKRGRAPSPGLWVLVPD